MHQADCVGASISCPKHRRVLSLEEALKYFIKSLYNPLLLNIHCILLQIQPVPSHPVFLKQWSNRGNIYRSVAILVFLHPKNLEYGVSVAPKWAWIQSVKDHSTQASVSLIKAAYASGFNFNASIFIFEVQQKCTLLCWLKLSQPNKVK